MAFSSQSVMTLANADGRSADCNARRRSWRPKPYGSLYDVIDKTHVFLHEISGTVAGMPSALGGALARGFRRALPAGYGSGKAVVLRPMSRRTPDCDCASGTNVPRQRGLTSLPASPEARFTGKHDRLIAMFDANLVEDPGDVIADRFFRESKRCGELRIVEALGDAFQNGPLTRS